jgi:hypothetical protein
MAQKRRYMGRPITKETIAFGIGGTLVKDDGFPELPARAILDLRLKAEFDNVKHTFLEKGGVQETLILTIDASSVEVLGVEEQPEQVELPTPEPESVQA